MMHIFMNILMILFNSIIIIILYHCYYLFTWILGVVSKQLRLLHNRVGDSITLVNFLSHNIGLLVEDAVFLSAVT